MFDDPQFSQSTGEPAPGAQPTPSQEDASSREEMGSPERQPASRQQPTVSQPASGGGETAGEDKPGQPGEGAGQPQTRNFTQSLIRRITGSLRRMTGPLTGTGSLPGETDSTMGGTPPASQASRMTGPLRGTGDLAEEEIDFSQGSSGSPTGSLSRVTGSLNRVTGPLRETESLDQQAGASPSGDVKEIPTGSLSRVTGPLRDTAGLGSSLNTSSSEAPESTAGPLSRMTGPLRDTGELNAGESDSSAPLPGAGELPSRVTGPLDETGRLGGQENRPARLDDTLSRGTGPLRVVEPFRQDQDDQDSAADGDLPAPDEAAAKKEFRPYHGRGGSINRMTGALHETGGPEEETPQAGAEQEPAEELPDDLLSRAGGAPGDVPVPDGETAAVEPAWNNLPAGPEDPDATMNLYSSDEEDRPFAGEDWMAELRQENGLLEESAEEAAADQTSEEEGFDLFRAAPTGAGSEEMPPGRMADHAEEDDSPARHKTGSLRSFFSSILGGDEQEPKPAGQKPDPAGQEWADQDDLASQDKLTAPENMAELESLSEEEQVPDDLIFGRLGSGLGVQESEEELPAAQAPDIEESAVFQEPSETAGQEITDLPFAGAAAEEIWMVDPSPDEPIAPVFGADEEIPAVRWNELPGWLGDSETAEGEPWPKENDEPPAALPAEDEPSGAPYLGVTRPLHWQEPAAAEQDAEAWHSAPSDEPADFEPQVGGPAFTELTGPEAPREQPQAHDWMIEMRQDAEFEVEQDKMQVLPAESMAGSMPPVEAEHPEESSTVGKFTGRLRKMITGALRGPEARRKRTNELEVSDDLVSERLGRSLGTERLTPGTTPASVSHAETMQPSSDEAPEVLDEIPGFAQPAEKEWFEETEITYAEHQIEEEPALMGDEPISQLTSGDGAAPGMAGDEARSEPEPDWMAEIRRETTKAEEQPGAQEQPEGEKGAIGRISGGVKKFFMGITRGPRSRQKPGEETQVSDELVAGRLDRSQGTDPLKAAGKDSQPPADAGAEGHAAGEFPGTQDQLDAHLSSLFHLEEEPTGPEIPGGVVAFAEEYGAFEADAASLESTPSEEEAVSGESMGDRLSGLFSLSETDESAVLDEEETFLPGLEARFDTLGLDEAGAAEDLEVGLEGEEAAAGSGEPGVESVSYELLPEDEALLWGSPDTNESEPLVPAADAEETSEEPASLAAPEWNITLEEEPVQPEKPAPRPRMTVEDAYAAAYLTGKEVPFEEIEERSDDTLLLRQALEKSEAEQPPVSIEEMRQIALEGYRDVSDEEWEETPVPDSRLAGAAPEGEAGLYTSGPAGAAYSEAGGWAAPAPGLWERFKRALRPRTTAQKLLLIEAGLVLLALLVAVPLFIMMITRGPVVRQAPVTNLLVPRSLPAGMPYPVSLTLPGGWQFPLHKSTFVNGEWKPASAEWLEGTELRRVIALPWNTQTEAVIQSFQPGDRVTVILSNQDNWNYHVTSVQHVAANNTSIFTDVRPSLVIVLFQENAKERWVVLCNP